jgi:N-acetylglutamate synthase-like GNAT family acetyltransferase
VGIVLWWNDLVTLNLWRTSRGSAHLELLRCTAQQLNLSPLFLVEQPIREFFPRLYFVEMICPHDLQQMIIVFHD